MKVQADYELDTSTESMRRRQVKTESDRITPVTFCIDRKIDAGHSANQALSSFLASMNAANNPTKGKRRYAVKSLGEMSVTYFGTLDFVAAIEQQGKRGLFQGFGRDEKRTRDAVTKVKGSFIEYLRDSRMVASVMAESSSLEPLLGDPFDDYDWRYDDGFSPEGNDEARSIKWEDGVAAVGRQGLTLDGNNYVYVALDLSSNPFLVEERSAIREHFKTEFGLRLQDRERWKNGKPIAHIMHSTIAKVPDSVFFDQPPVIGRLPGEIALLAPGIEAHANVNK